MKRVLLTILLLFVVAFGANAAPASYNAHFPNMDQNGDDLINWEEFSAYFDGAEKSAFEEADANANGELTHGEWHQFKKARGYSHCGGGKKGCGGCLHKKQ